MKILDLHVFLAVLIISASQITAQIHEIRYQPCTTCDEGNHNQPYNNGNHSYGAAIQFQTSHVSSDYGPRHLSANNPYDWHGGVDFGPEGWPNGNDDYGDAILAIRGDTITHIGQLFYKNIIIDGIKK